MRVVSHAEQWPLGPFLAIIGGLAFAVLLSFGYTTWAIGYHSHQSCTELRILGEAGGATTAYDRTVQEEFHGLYELRCG